MVGTQRDFAKAVTELLELEHSARDALSAAVSRLDNQEYRTAVEGMLRDHDRHISELSSLLQKHGQEVPTSSGTLDMKSMVTQSKVMLSQIAGDKAILTALASNEVDTNTAYERMLNHEGKWSDAAEIITKGFEDERRHKEWLERASD